VYAAILGILALLLFLSPQIAKFISADTSSREILQNINFTDKLNDRAWNISYNDQKNSALFTDDKFVIQNQLSKDNFTLAAQRLELIKNKTYLLQINYRWDNNRTASDLASFGILKYGLKSESALSFSLANSANQIEMKKYFIMNESIKDPYFYVLFQGSGTLEISKLSLLEFDKTPDGATLESITSGQFLPIKMQGGDYIEGTPTPSPSASSSPSPAPTISPSTSPSPSTSVSASAVPNRSPQVSAGSKTIIYPGWNVIKISQDTSSEVFTQSSLLSFQMFGGQWKKGKKNQPQIVFNKEGAVYVYSSLESKKEINLPQIKLTSTLKTGKGWNLLANQSAAEIKLDSEFELNGSKVKLKNLIEDKKISSEIYILNSSSQGVEMKKIDPSKESIPQNSSFWLFLLR
jgi:hypothetical protein